MIEWVQNMQDKTILQITFALWSVGMIALGYASFMYEDNKLIFRNHLIIGAIFCILSIIAFVGLTHIKITYSSG